MHKIIIKTLIMEMIILVHSRQTEKLVKKLMNDA